MITPLSWATGATYRRLVKPVLFKSSPDTVHERMIRSARFVGKNRFMLGVMRQVFRAENPSVLQQTVHGLTFPNPIGLAAGLDKNGDLVPMLPAIGFGFGTVGSVTSQPCEGNPKPWFHRMPELQSLLVHVGLANSGTPTVQQKIHSYPPKTYTNFSLVVSVAKTNSRTTCTDHEAIQDYTTSLRLLQHDSLVNVLELNISCPNTYGGEPFTDAKRLEKLLSAVDALGITKPIWVKMPINHSWKEFEALLKVITKHNVQGVTIGNLNKDRSAFLSETEQSHKGNLSGLPTQALSDSLIAKTYAHYGDTLTIIGVGGVFSAEDAYRKICLGATLVELVTGLIYRGPQLPGHINRELIKLCQKDGFDSISQAIGSKTESVLAHTKP
ncbi:MAG: quinone-dependent dihydroorotate dehydrogenase [Candidatus Saccharimonadales bacterium]